jgi:urocanate hydratase
MWIVMTKQDFSQAMTIKLPSELPPYPEFITEYKGRKIRRAPKRKYQLTKTELVIALKNGLRYVPEELHEDIAPEFLTELSMIGEEGRGRVYGYRFRPPGAIQAKPVDQYEGILEARALQLMLDNNVDFDIALYPYELVTYGECGQVCQNWMQFQLIKKYLESMTEEQTLVVSSGHPVGLFPSSRTAPRVISTNGLMVGEFDTPEPNDLPFLNAAAMGVTSYGQMTAGGWMYIGPQGIVHGTYITLLNAGRKYLDIPLGQNLGGKVYLTSGLGGMSGAQGKAVEIAGGIGVIAEVEHFKRTSLNSLSW